MIENVERCFVVAMMHILPVHITSALKHVAYYKVGTKQMKSQNKDYLENNEGNGNTRSTERP